MIVWKWTLMVTLDHILFQNCYCMCLFNNSKAALLLTQSMVDSKRQEMQRIISLSVILNYPNYFHSKFKNVNLIQGHVFFKMLYICQNYVFLITTMAWSVFLKLKYQSLNAQNIKYWGKSNCVNETYIKHIKYIFISHGRHIYTKVSDMAKATMYEYKQSDDALPHWKCVFRCCAKFPCVNLPDQEID